MTLGNQRDITVRPQRKQVDDNLLTMKSGESGNPEVNEDDAEGGLADESAGEEESVKSEPGMASKVEELQRRVAEHFEDANDRRADGPPIVKAPSQPTKGEWEAHQTTHTPYQF